MNSRRTDAARQGARQTTESAPQGRQQGVLRPPPRKQMDTVSIEIRGKRLSIRTDHDPEYVRELSRYVDDKINELQMMPPSAPFEKLLMLASLTLAEELFEAQGELVDIKNDLSDRTEAMLALIEEESARLGE